MKTFSILPLAFVLFACGESTETSEQASTELAATETPVVETASVANIETNPETANRGKVLFLRCRSCHSTDAEGRHKVGPNLNGLFGANAGAKEGFNYSEPMSSSGIVWSANTLNAFLTKPSDYIPGNRMAFAGLANEADRIAVISFLEAETQ